ncbi:hypothetical protein [Crassaminicella profunda]|uniref:hypothetical protein n=1 Tax=Crassaminicella profunda TaxID=1286698 RepID=UPI001CA7835E|nr:hypothetical protein [Crassaminicella profunda]QZY53894.1 hypothetical protein K7H06_12610 [Crassaminicella profunda]
MKKQSISSTIELVYSENENAKLNFIKFMVDYFMDHHIAEVNMYDNQFSTSNKKN